MKITGLFQKGAAAVGLFLLTFAGYQADAQYIPVTLSLTMAEFNALATNGSISVNALSYNTFAGNGMMNIGPAWGTYGGPGETACPQQMTSEQYQWMLSEANRTCQTVHMCLQASDCQWYNYYVNPTSLNCIYVGSIGPYRNMLTAYRMP